MGLVERRTAALLAGACAVAALGMTSAFAQDGVSDDKQGRVTLLDRIVVGAGVEKVAVDTPQAVTVVNQDDLDKEQATTIGDVLDRVPGVTAIGSDRVVGQSFNIRGIGGLAAADESKIIITVDGATKFYEQYRMGSFFSDPELYKQVEVLRGPASSTLYGSGALGGVINMTTKDASDFLADGMTSALRLKTTLDSNRGGVLGSAIMAHRFSDQTDFLLSGNFRRADPYENGNGVKAPGSEFESWSGLAKLTHRFGMNDEQVVRLSYQRWQSDADDTEYSQTGTLSVFGTIDRLVTDQTAVFSYENPASDNPWLDLTFNATYSDTTVEQDDASNPPMFSPIFAPANYGYRTFSTKLENTMEYQGGSFENYLTAGVQFSHQKRTATTSLGGLTTHPEGTDTKIGLYVQDEFIWDDRLTIIPGVRADFISLQPDASIAGASDVDEVAFSPKIAAHYKFNDTFAVFGSIAHTERSPTLDELFSYDVPTATYPGGRLPSLSLELEKSNNFEAGFSVSGYDLITEGDALQFKTTAFYNDLTNLITPNPNTGMATPVVYYVNVDEAEIYGVEVEAAYDAESWFASAAYSHVHGEDSSTGATLNTIPADTLSLTLGGRVPERNLEFGWRALFAGAMTTGATTGPYPSYQVHDAYVSWKPDNGTMAGFELQASVENIFNEQYRNNLAGDDGKGRTFKLSLAKTFGR